MIKSYSVHEFAQKNKEGNVDALLKHYKEKFEKRFNTSVEKHITLNISFEDSLDMTQFYQELRYHRAFKELYTVKTHPSKSLTLLVSGKETLFDYLGSKEPNLLTISRMLGIDFKVSFKQAYSGTDFEGTVISGELLSRQCIVEVSPLLPELSLGLLNQIGQSAQELELLLTRIIPVEAVSIL